MDFRSFIFEYEIFLVKADGKEPPQQLTTGLLGITGSLDWSPDGRYLLISAGPPNDKDIFRLDLQANIITRREETASTRSLLNTVKLMEENPLLLRLKEMEYIEQITSRIDRLSLGGSEPVIEQLTKLFGVSTPHSRHHPD